MKKSREIAKKYAAALLSIAVDNGELAEVEKEITNIQRVICENRELAGFLYHPLLAREAKKEVVKKLFANEVRPIVLHFLEIVIERGRINLLDEITSVFIELSHEERNIQEAKVRSAVPLTAEEEQALQTQLSKLTGKDVYLTTAVDPSILGGIIVTIGDQMIDGSMTRQLQELKATLLEQDTKGLR